jgi:hypothetical protein
MLGVYSCFAATLYFLGEFETARQNPMRDSKRADDLMQLRNGLRPEDIEVFRLI